MPIRIAIFRSSKLFISMTQVQKNIDSQTLYSFGDEWNKFRQSSLDKKEALRRFDEYFGIFPWDLLPPNPEGFDMGCGTGRWSQFVAPRVGGLHCIDPASKALDVARNNLSKYTNVHFHLGAADDHCLPPGSQDFGFSLGVLHHVPDTQKGIKDCVRMLKPGAPLLLYLYYAFDNRPFWFRLIWRFSDAIRRIIYRLPSGPKGFISELIAVFIYYPLAVLSRLLSSSGVDVSRIPLSYYRDCSFYSMRTDSRDRFGTPLEHRYTRSQIAKMCLEAGLCDLKFSENAPYWCVAGLKAYEH